MLVEDMESRVLLTDVVSLAVLDASASELSGDTGTFRISRSGTQGGLTVNFLVAASSTATVGTDYAPINGTVAFADGESWKDVTIAPVDDSVPEAMKNLSVSIVPAAAGEYIVGLQSSGTITIADDDTPGGLIRFNLTGTQSVTEAVTDSDNNLTTYTIGYTGTLSGSNTASVDIAHLFNQTGNSDYVTSLTTAITNAVANTPGTSFNGTTLRFGAPSNTVSSASRFAGAAVNAGGWANPALATGNTPGDFASIPLDDRDTSGDLRLTQFGFNIPSNATITGITASLNTTGSNTSRGGAGLKVTKDGSVAVGAPPISTTNWDTGSVVVGSNSSRWGTSWTPAEINSPNFGLIVNVRSDDDGYQFRVASANIVVSYTTPDGTAPSSITFSASIADDTTGEGSEAYTVALSNPVTTLPQGSTIANSSVTTTIVDNDVAFSITGLNSSITESTIDGDGNT
ncbi:MAG: Calx-beta domain-containing protein, partial [Planctomyces sp.]